MKTTPWAFCLAVLMAALASSGAQAQNCPVDAGTGNAVARLVKLSDGVTPVPESPTVNAIPAIDPVSKVAGAVTFEWCNAQADYFLVVESVAGAKDIYNAFVGGTNAGLEKITLGPACNVPTPTSPTTGCIPMKGEQIFVTLYTTKRGAFLPPSPIFYTFQAANVSGTPPPAPLIATGPASPTRQTTATFTFSDSDATATFRCALDSNAPAAFSACASGKSYGPGLAEGPHTFYVLASNATGDSAVTSYAWTVDSVAPAVVIDSAPVSPTNQSTANFAFHASEVGGLIECNLDGVGFAACASPAAFSGLADGQHSLVVRATDTAGNVGSTSFSWTVDTLAPDTAIDSGPTASTTSNAAAFTFHAAGAVHFSCQLDALPAAPCDSGTANFTAAPEIDVQRPAGSA